MRLIGFLALCAIAWPNLLVAETAKDQGNGRPKVVGGQGASDNAFPWVGALINTEAPSFQGQFCGAAVVHPRWVATAASCVDGRPVETIEVGVGGTGLSALQRIGVIDIVIHPEFDRLTLESDLALLLLEEAVPESVNSLALLDDLSLEEPGNIASVLGWGATDASGNLDSFPEFLHVASLPIVANEVGNVAGIYNGQLTERMLIAGFEEGGVGTCFADTGGPLVVQGTAAGEWYLAGVASFTPPGKACAAPEAYSGFTRVSAYRTWIESYIRPGYRAWESGQSVSGATRDPEADGRINYHEFATFADPTSSGDAPWGEFSTTEHAGANYPAVTFIRRADTDEIDYGVQFSTGGEIWIDLDTSALTVSVESVPGGVAEMVTVRAPTPIAELPTGVALFRQTVRASASVPRVGREITVPGYAYSALSTLDRTAGGGLAYKDFEIVSPPAGFEFEISARSERFNPVLQLLDGLTGAVIAQSAGNTGGSTHETLAFTPQIGQRYTLRVISSGAGELGAFSVAIYEPLPTGLPTASAGQIVGQLTTSDAVDPAGLPAVYYQDDFIYQTPSYEEFIYVFLTSDTGAGGFDTYLLTFNGETGGTVVENDDSSPTNSNSFGVFTALPNVPYVVRVTSFAPEATGPYLLDLVPLRVVAGGGSYDGTLEASDERNDSGFYTDDHYLAAPPAGSVVTATVSSASFDPYLLQYDAVFGFLAEDDNSGAGTSASITTVADGVTSYIYAVTSALPEQGGDYTLTVAVEEPD